MNIQLVKSVIWTNLSRFVEIQGRVKDKTGQWSIRWKPQTQPLQEITRNWGWPMGATGRRGLHMPVCFTDFSMSIHPLCINFLHVHILHGRPGVLFRARTSNTERILLPFLCGENERKPACDWKGLSQKNSAWTQTIFPDFFVSNFPHLWAIVTVQDNNEDDLRAALFSRGIKNQPETRSQSSGSRKALPGCGVSSFRCTLAPDVYLLDILL